MIKAPQDKVASSGTESAFDAGPDSMGRSLTPPSFQLTATNPSGQAGGGQGGDAAGGPLQLKDPQAQKQARCVNPDAEVGEEWVQFAKDFNIEFKEMLHVFQQDAMACGKEATKDDPALTDPKAAGEGIYKGAYAKKGAQSGDPVSAATLKGIFTDGQREKIASFMATKTVPERLFDGDDIGNATVSQRMCISAHILMTGTYSPSGYVQKLHAHNCGDWIGMVFNYAGCAVGFMNQGMNGLLDHQGNVILTKGKLDQPYMGASIPYSQLPKDTEESLTTTTVTKKRLKSEQTGFVERVEPGTKHEGTLNKQKEKIAQNEKQKAEGTGPYAKGADPKKVPAEPKMTVTRRTFAGWDVVSKIKPGDWVWIYNANEAPDGGHSLMFSRWAGPEKSVDGVRYRLAIGYNQGDPKYAGSEVAYLLGEDFKRVPRGDDSGKTDTLYPVTMVQRASEDTKPMTTADEFLPGALQGEDNETDVNSMYLKEVVGEGSYPAARQALLQHLKERALATIDKIAHRLTKGQQALLNEAAESTSIGQLVYTVSRLEQIQIVVQALDERDSPEFKKEMLNAYNDWEAQHQSVIDQISLLTDGVAEVEANIAELNEKKEELDVKKEIDQATKQLKALQAKQYGLKKSDPNYATKSQDFDAAIAEAKATLAKLAADKTTNAAELKQVLDKIVAAKKALAAAKEDLKDAEAAKGSLEGPDKLPYTLSHPGGTSVDPRTKDGTTSLENFMSKDAILSACGVEKPKPAEAPKSTKKSGKKGAKPAAPTTQK